MKREMEAYIVLLHLVSQGWATFKDIRHLVGWDVWKQSEAIRIVAHINHKILDLSDAWDEDIPRINVFMFNEFGKCTSYVCKEIFECDKEEQPSPRQIVEYAQKVAAYENWDKVLQAFREEALIVKSDVLRAITHTPRTIAERYVAGTTEANRDEVARKVVELRINATGSKSLAWRKIREKLGLQNNEFHEVIRLSEGYRKAVIDRIKSLRAQEGGWEYSGNLKRLTGIELTEEELS